MEFLIALLINLLVCVILILVVFWIIGLFAEEIPPRILKVVKAIITLIFLLWLLEVLFGHGPTFYPVPHLTR